METALRKEKHNLTISGVGAIALGAWLFLKRLMYPLFAGDYLTETFGMEALPDAGKTVVISLWLLVGFFIMVLHVYIGLCAVSEGSGKSSRRRRAYLLLAGLLTVVCLVDLVIDLWNVTSISGSWLDWLCDVAMEAVRGANLVVILRAAQRTRKLQAAQKEAASHAD